MNRLKANIKILDILGEHPSPEMLKIVDCIPDRFQYKALQYAIKDFPEGRFIQILWSGGQNLSGHGEGDRFYEESEITLEKLLNYVRESKV